MLLLPVDPDASARALAAGLRSSARREVGVIVSDTLGRAWREGQTDSAIGAGGVHVFEDLRGQTDAEGRPARRHDAVRRRRAGRGRRPREGQGVAPARSPSSADAPTSSGLSTCLARDRSCATAERDMFRLGADEAYADGFAAGAASVTASSSPRTFRSGP